MEPLVSPMVLWALSSLQVVLILAVLLVQAVLIAGLLLARSKQRKAEREYKRLSDLREKAQSHLNEKRFEKESEQRFRDVSDTAPVMIWIAAPDKSCTYVNKPWIDFKGSTLEKELSNGWLEGIHPGDVKNCREAFSSSVDARRQFETEYRLLRHDGEYRWIYDSGVPRFSPDGTFLGFIGSCIDITERKESEVALKTANEELQQLKNQLEAENIYLQQELQLDQKHGEIIGQSDAIKYVLFKITQVAPTDSTVLITGETGTGKELAARAIHSASSRKDRPLIKVNCGALSPTLIESELFGTKRARLQALPGRNKVVLNWPMAAPFSSTRLASWHRSYK